MAVAELTADHTEGQRLYSAWRVARANWELARYDPSNLGDDLPDEIGAMHCEADHSALMAYFLHPVADLYELSRKLRTFDEEDGSGLTRSSEIASALARDARNLCMEEARRHCHGAMAKAATFAVGNNN